MWQWKKAQKVRGEQSMRGEEWVDRNLSIHNNISKLPINNIYIVIVADMSFKWWLQNRIWEQNQHINFPLSGDTPWAKGVGPEKGLLSLPRGILLSTEEQCFSVFIHP